MTPSYTLAAAAMLWSHPGTAPCNATEPNPCWIGPMPTTPSEICDGDLVRMMGAVNGVATPPRLMIVALDVAHLIAKGFRFRTREDGATCIPTLTDGAVHLVEACGNWAEVLARDSITATAIRSLEYMRGGVSPASARTGGGASAHVASPLFPPVHVGNPGKPRPPSPPDPYNPPYVPDPYDPDPYVSAVPLPAPLLLMLAALAGLWSMGRRA